MAKKKSFFERHEAEIRDIASRAIRTFAQALGASLTVPVLLGGDVEQIKSALVAAVAAGLSVIYNALLAYLNR